MNPIVAGSSLLAKGREREKQREIPEPEGKRQKDRDRRYVDTIDIQIQIYREIDREGEPKLELEGKIGDRDRICVDILDRQIDRQIERGYRQNMCRQIR